MKKSLPQMEQIRNENPLSLWTLKLPEGLKQLSIAQCTTLCKQVRDILIDTVSKRGGHLASSLGAVELTFAIHRVFSSPKDRIVWDVGHQAYTHKILTGRLKKFSTLRQEGGISGFPKPSENVHDAFISGHSSNSISAACGLARGMKLSGDGGHVIAVIGDGAFTGGMAYEGMNNAGKSDDNLIVILNQNDMSISKNVGALANYLTTIRANPEYLNTKNFVEKSLDKLPIVGKPLKKVIKTSKSVIKGALYHSTMFEDFGFVYLGPIDGHNMYQLEKTLKMAKSLKRPVLVHVNTVKGKGYAPAEKNPGAFHGLSKLELKNGNPEVISEDSYSAVFGRELCRLAERYTKICAVTAAMKYGTGLQYFYAEHKQRFFDVGIAEQHAVTFAAGLAKAGLLPVVAIYSSFLQRAYDQILHDCAIENTHIVLAVDRAGVVGEDGETHQGIFDVAFLTSIPNITIFSPACYEELRLCLREALFACSGVVAVRYPRGNDCSTFKKQALNTDFSIEKNGSNTLLVAYGRVVENVYGAEIETGNKKFDVLKLTKIFPISEQIIAEILKYESVFFFEEGIRSGSIAEHIATRLVEGEFCGKIHISAIDGFVKHATMDATLDGLGLSKKTIGEVLQQAIQTGDINE